MRKPYTFYTFLGELVATLLMVPLVWIGVSIGWHIFGLREGAMFAFGLLVVMPVALTPFFTFHAIRR